MTEQRQRVGRHPETGELRLLHHEGTHRERNRSLEFRAAERAQLEAEPTCACGQPATEAHAARGICQVSPPPEELVSVCRVCHDATHCTAPRVSAFDLRLHREGAS